jgi:hypothetical protein
MPGIVRSARCALLPFIALLAIGGTAFAASPARASHRHAAVRMNAVTIAITTTSGTVWGSVTAKYTYQHHLLSRSCAAASCTTRIPQGVTVHFSQTAKDSSTWPFKSWQLTANHKTRTVTSNAPAVKVNGPMIVSAVYVLSQAQSSPPPPSYGYSP